jgi:hypothetical protein
MKFPSKVPRGKPAKQLGKGQLGKGTLLPNRAALHQLTMGSPAQRSTGAYARATPSGAAGMAQGYDALTDMGVPPGDETPPGTTGTDLPGG